MYSTRIIFRAPYCLTLHLRPIGTQRGRGAADAVLGPAARGGRIGVGITDFGRRRFVRARAPQGAAGRRAVVGRHHV